MTSRVAGVAVAAALLIASCGGHELSSAEELAAAFMAAAEPEHRLELVSTSSTHDPVDTEGVAMEFAMDGGTLYVGRQQFSTMPSRSQSPTDCDCDFELEQLPDGAELTTETNRMTGANVASLYFENRVAFSISAVPTEPDAPAPLTRGELRTLLRSFPSAPDGAPAT